MPQRIILLLLSCLLVAAPTAAQEAAPDSLVPATQAGDQAYTHCLDDLHSLDQATAALDSILATGGEDRDLMRIGAIDQVERIQGLLSDLVGRLPDEAEAPAWGDSVREATVAHLVRQLTLQRNSIDHLYDSVEEMWKRRPDVPVTELVGYESDLDRELQLIDRVVGWLLETADLAGALEVELGSLWPDMDANLQGHAETMAGRVRVAAQERERLATQLKVAEAAGSGADEISVLRLNLQATSQRLNTNVEALRRSIRHLERRGIDASVHREVLVSSTGEISVQLLDPEVLRGLASKALAGLGDWLREQGPTLLMRAAILVVFIFLFRWTARLVWWLVLARRAQRSSRLLQDLTGRMLVPTSTVLGLFAGLWFLGVNPTTLLAGVGVASVILGLALQDSLGNLAAGAFILLYRPYDVDDTVQAAGVVGMVKAMGLANTTIVTFDNRRLFVPNRKIWSEVIENRSMEDRRRVETVVRIEYGEDVERVTGIIRQALDDSELVLEDPEPSIFVSQLDESWIEISVWPWTAMENWWTLRISLPRLMLDTLHAHGIRIPYARRDISLTRDDGVDRETT